MQDLTSSVSDDDVIRFFMEKISPHVLKYQSSAICMQSPASQHLTTGPAQGKDVFLNKLESKLVVSVEGLDTDKVRKAVDQGVKRRNSHTELVRKET